LDTHPDLRLSRKQTDMASQRLNWLRRIELIEEDGEKYSLTPAGRQLVESAVDNLGRTELIPNNAIKSLLRET